MKKLRIYALLAVLVILPVSAFAISGDAIFYTNYPDLSGSQTQVVSVDINTGTVPSINDMHFGVGARGPSYDQSFPLGRGVVFGRVSQCEGVMVEDFTKNRSPGNGLIPGTCVSIVPQSNWVYRITMSVTANDVSWQLYEFRFVGGLFRWVLLATGGCLATSGQPCPKQASDGNAADVFVGATMQPGAGSWEYYNLSVTHY